MKRALAKLPAVRTLLLMRHAKSSWRDAGLSDHDRPLNGRGKRAASFMGNLLLRENLLPEMVLSSTAVRAVETVRGVVAASNLDGPVEIKRTLYLAEPPAYLDALTEVPQGIGRLLVIGHNPGISELVHVLTGDRVEMPTAAVACIDLDVGEICDVDRLSRGTLRFFHRPPKEDKKK